MEEVELVEEVVMVGGGGVKWGDSAGCSRSS